MKYVVCVRELPYINERNIKEDEKANADTDMRFNIDYIWVFK